MTNKLDKLAIKTFYEESSTVWPENDKWHLVNQQEIKNYLHKINFPSNANILNVGSGGNNYGLLCPMWHLDVAANKIDYLDNYIVGSAEAIPCPDNTFSHVICVGSVLNYCDAIKVINEIVRVLKPNGSLILEFEGSYSFEYFLTTAFRKSAAIANTMYFGKPHQMWVYSEKYIINLLKQSSFLIQETYRFHILSSLAYKICNDENLASKYSRYDCLLRQIPIIKKYAANIILFCTKSN